MLSKTIEQICHQCGKKYIVRESRDGRTKFCSDKCFRESKNTQIDVSCSYCGKTFKTRKSKYDAFKNGERTGLYCSTQCAKDVQKPKWESIQDAFSNRGYILLSDAYVSAKSKLRYVCSKHADYGEQLITYDNFRSGYGCKLCGRERTSDARRLSFDDVRRIFDRNDMELLEQPYYNTSMMMAYICKHHREVGVQYMCTSNAYTQRCPYCHVAKGEHMISDYLLKNKIDFERQKKFDGLVGLKGKSLSYDFYLPKYNLLIEYQGRQHEMPVDVFGGDDSFAIQKEHDMRKRKYAESNAIDLLEIWYFDFKHISEILSNKLQ